MEVTTNLFEHDGCKFMVREGTNDRDVIRSIFSGEYAVPGGAMPGHAAVSIDVGAHIGAFSVWACAKYPHHNCLAIEPLPENRELIHLNASLNGMRFTVINGAAGSEAVPFIEIGYNCEEDESGRIHHFIGNAMAIKRGGKSFNSPRVTLNQIIRGLWEKHGVEEVWTLKLDAENGEYPLIEEASYVDLRRSSWIIGEYHDKGIEPIRRKLLNCGFKEHSAPTGHFCFELQ